MYNPNRGAKVVKTKINIQDQVLNISRKERLRVEVLLLTGEKLQGNIRSFDNFSLLLDGRPERLIYKHGVVMISLLDPLPEFQRLEEGKPS
jgi:host factor-I protein